MKHCVLIVDDDARIRQTAASILDSLKLEHEEAASQAEATDKLVSGKYCCVLLDLEIPVRESTFARQTNGENLLREIRANEAIKHIPVVIMTGHGNDSPALAVKLMKLGAVDFVSKPFGGDALDRAVLDAIATFEKIGRGQVKVKTAGDLKPFAGGRLVLHEDRVELCDVRILNNEKSSQMWAILQQLNSRLQNGRYRAMDGGALAKTIQCRGGQPSIAGSVRDFRKQLAETIATELGLRVAQMDVISSGTSGYRFNEWIEVVDARSPRSTVAATASGKAEPVDSAQERRQRVLDELKRGQTRAPAIAKQLGLSLSTIKRILEELKAEAVVVFEGPTKTGFYRIASK